MKPKFLDNKYVKIIVYFISILLILYATFLVVQNYNEIKEQINQGNKLFLLFSLFLFILYTIVIIYAWKLIILEKVKFRDAFVIYTTTQLGKYIPGKIWVYAAQIYFLKRYGIDFKEVIVKTVIFYTLFFLSAIVFSAGAYGIYINNPIPIVASLVGSYIFVWTILLPFYNKKEIFRYLISFSVMILDLILGWVASYYLIMAIYPTTLINTVLIAASSYIAWIIGFVVLIAPAGLGIREGANIWIIHSVLKLPMGIASLYPLAMRLIMSVTEIITIFLGIYIGKSKGLLDLNEIKEIETKLESKE